MLQNRRVEGKDIIKLYTQINQHGKWSNQIFYYENLIHLTKDFTLSLPRFYNIIFKNNTFRHMQQI